MTQGGARDSRATSRPAAPPPGTARAVYTDILRFGPRPRTELAARLDLSGPTITRITRSLLDAGLLRELPSVPQLKGRPQEPLDVDADHARFIGVKVTAQMIHAVVTDPRANALEELAVPLASRSPGAVARCIQDLVRPLAGSHPHVAGVGVSLGGRVTGRRDLHECSMLGWERPVELAEDLERRLGLPVALENDMISLLHGVLWFGIGRRWESFLLLTIGQGVGLGIVERGRVIEGSAHLAGQTAHLTTAARDGRAVLLGKSACTDALLAAARASGAVRTDDGLPVLLAAAHAGVPGALEVSREVTHQLAVAAAGLAGAVGAQAVLLGGEAIDLVRRAGQRRGDDPRDRDDAPTFEDLLRDRLAPAQRGIAVRGLSDDFDEWARGAAVIAVQEFLGSRG